MIDQASVPSLMGSTVRDSSGDKIGKVGQVYLDDTTGQPEWVTVKTGLFGTKENFVPLAAARVEGDELVVDVTKDKVTDAPKLDEDGHLTEEQETELYTYYGVSQGSFGRQSAQTDTGYAAGTTTDSAYDTTDTSYQPAAGTTGYDTTTTDTTATTGGYDTTAATGGYDTTDTTTTRGDRDGDGVRDDLETGTVGHDTSGPNTDDAMTRSEEHLVAGTQTQEAGRARLRKYVVTETEQVEVPVSREEVRLEREPITDSNAGAAYSGKDISEEEHEVTLHAERPVVGTETEAVERVRLGKETVTDTETVTGEVRKEQIEFDDPTGTARDGR
jgi:uncharacterized protein (TIGR02271 family)